MKDYNTEVLQLGYAYCILSTLTDIYVIGDEMDYKYYVWKNFEKQFQIKDCDAINDACVSEWNQGIDEPINNAMFAVYPNPASGVVFVRLPQCDNPTTGQTEYRITNLMGQTLLQGSINAENQQIDIANLPAGMYFISVDGETVKFVVK